MATQSNSVLSRPAAASQPKPYTSSLAPSRSYLASSIGTKVLIGATGLLLFTYLILHLAGNVLVFFGPEVFNGYSHLLISNPLVIPIEIGLAAIFVIHIYKAVTNFIANRRARPVKYYQTAWSGKPSRKNLASTTMILSGLIIFGFVLLHLWQFKYGPSYVVEQATPGAAGGEPVHGIRDLYRLEMEVFSNPLNVGFYVVAMIVVGSHLWHGIA
ncbi:MAG: succinate dehydrogenase cytochrome b subunit, partial [Chloroflexota bacterium]